MARVSTSVRVYFDGTDVSNAKRTYLDFHVYGQEWRFLYQKKLYVIVDGVRIDHGEGQHEGKVTSTRHARVSEWLTFKIDRDTLTKFGQAKTLEMQVGGLELRIEPEHQEAFRNVLSLIEP